MKNPICYSLKKEPILPLRVGVVEGDDATLDFFDTTTVPQIINELYDHIVPSQPPLCKIIEAQDCKDCYISAKNIDFTPGNTLYFFFGVCCRKDTDCIAILQRGGASRLWINGSLFSVRPRVPDTTYTFSLQKGMNVLCIEWPQIRSEDFFSFRLNSISNENNEGCASLSNSLSNRTCPFELHTHLVSPGIFKYIIYPTDKLYAPSHTIVQVRSYSTEEILHRESVAFYEEKTINLLALSGEQAKDFYIYVEFLQPSYFGALFRRVLPLPLNQDYQKFRFFFKQRSVCFTIKRG